VVTLKQEILARDGKLVIRPDSGDPVDILCGKGIYQSGDRLLTTEEIDEDVHRPSFKGVIELLWDVFGGTINEQGYKVLDPHIGAIYGDSITIDRAEEICSRLEAKGFASTNVVLGIGSFTYQYNTRDTFGFAMKATYCEVRSEGREIFKDPITDDGTKKSATGLLRVVWDTFAEQYQLMDKQTWEQEKHENNQLKTIYSNGDFPSTTTLAEIKNRLKYS